MKILIADDDPICQKVLSHTLEMMLHDVVACTNGLQAWETFEKSPQSFSLIISDWMMPELDGLEFCKKIREFRKKEEYTYFILLTSQSDSKETKMQATKAEIDDFMKKPIDRDQIWMRLHVAERILKYTKHINQLEQLLPICSYCKKIREKDNSWEAIDTYLMEKIDASLSHSICPDCYPKALHGQA